MTETPKPPEDGTVTEPAAATEPTRVLPAAWERIPKTIPHTRARTSTVVLLLLFVGLLWWYLDLYAQFVPEEQRRTGQTPVATTTAPVQEEPTYEAPLTTTTRAPSSTVRPSGAPGESGAPSSTVAGASSAPSEGPRTGPTSSSPEIAIPGIGTLTVPGAPGATTVPPASGGAPTTAVPPA